MIYRYTPTRHGFITRLDSGDKADREAVCALYPENKRKNLLSEKDRAVMDRYPFRPVVYAKLSPQYQLDLSMISGLAGYGRIAVRKNGETKWLDDFESIETEYRDGMMTYTARDGFTGDIDIRVRMIPTAIDSGLVLEIDCREIDCSAEIYLLHGGMLGYNMHSPLRIPFCADMCWGNEINILDGLAEITLTDEDKEPTFSDSPVSRYAKYEKYTRNSSCANSAWIHIPDWKRKVFVRAENNTVSVVPPDSLLSFDPDNIRSVPCAYGAAVCVKMKNGQINDIAVGYGGNIRYGSLEELKKASVSRLSDITSRLTVISDDTALDGAANIASTASQAIFGDNVFIHGAVSWKDGYLGWRGTYGPAAYGMTDEVGEHFRNHFRYSRITEGPDRGALCDTIEGGAPDRVIFYSMYETAVDQAKNYWEYTGDREFEKDLLEVTEGCIDRACRRLRPGKELLFENSLNTWVSDSHWTVMGQCAQSSAYMYNMFRLASRLSPGKEDKKRYAEMADRLRKDLNDVLWLRREGIFAYARDLRGSRMIHTHAELADIYHPIEFGLTDKYQAYQMLDWAEGNLKTERTDNGGTLFWNSDWYPNAGRSYTHSTYELNMGEEMNLAMAYQLTGLTEKGYDVFKTAYMAMFGGREPDFRDIDMDKYYENGHPPILTALACDIPCQVSVNGTPRRNALFGDSVGMFGKVLIEGVFGIRPEIPEHRINLTPHLPDEIKEIDIRGALLSYHYKSAGGETVIDYDVHKDVKTLHVTLTMPVSEILSVANNGDDAGFTVEPHFCSVLLHTDIDKPGKGRLKVRYRPADIKRSENRMDCSDGQMIELYYPNETVNSVYDPQRLFSEISYKDDHFRGRISAEKGSGVFFLMMRAGDTDYIRPVPVMIGDKGSETEIWKGYKEKYAPPYIWKTVDMDKYFNGDSPLNVLTELTRSAIGPKPEYSQVNFGYYKMHLVDRNIQLPSSPLDDSRWRSLVGADGIAVTGEGIPFRSKKAGDYLAAAALNNTAYPDRIIVPADDEGRAVYLLITGISFPMQSGVENLRIILNYEDGVNEIHPLVNPETIGDMWSTIWRRWHDTPANGFEKLGGYLPGPDSSYGQDLTRPIETGIEAHIIHFPLREGIRLKEIEMRITANDVLFSLMGITILK